MVMSWAPISIGNLLRYVDERVELQEDKEYSTITVRRRHGGLEIRERLFGQQIATKKQFRLVPGAFIISRIQCWHEAYAIVGSVPQNAIASTNYDQFAISPTIDPNFFWWLSHTPAFTETVRSSASGVVVEKMVFDREKWLTKTLRVPDLSEQQRMVSVIEGYVDRIDEAKALRHESMVEAEALIVSIHRQLAQGRMRKLGDILQLSEQQTRVVETESFPQVGVRSFGGGLFPKASIKGTETTYRIFNRLYAGAVVLSQVKGWEGAVAVCPSEMG